ncbi:MAG: GtrA family protein [Oscillospiraceae bacterium]|nr:GtrA family protein [Oscillospiraceae bacterium]
MMDEPRIYPYLEKLVPKPLRPLTYKYRQFLSYAFFGFATTAVNFIIYYPLSLILPYLAANPIAWFGSVVFSYWVNKTFVFSSPSWDIKTVAKEFLPFAGGRVISLGAEEVVLYIGTELIGVPHGITKFAAACLVAVMNYFFAKIFVFKKK